MFANPQKCNVGSFIVIIFTQSRVKQCGNKQTNKLQPCALYCAPQYLVGEAFTCCKGGKVRFVFRLAFITGCGDTVLHELFCCVIKHHLLRPD